MFFVAVGLYTLSAILSTVDVFLVFIPAFSVDAFMAFGGFVGGVFGVIVTALPVIALWLFLDASKNTESINVDGKKVLTGLKLARISLIINICLIGILVVFGLITIFLSMLLEEASNLLFASGLLIIFTSGIAILQLVLAMGLVKGLRDGLYRGYFKPLPRSSAFTVVVTIQILLAIIMMFLSPNLLSGMGVEQEWIDIIGAEFASGLSIGTFASLSSILAMGLFLILLRQFNDAVKDDTQPPFTNL